jgi:DMSO/TMAO reductase YedYZ molybdopterin-dependent catalytic subunit
VQHAFQRTAARVNPIIFGRVVPRMHWKESDIGPAMWTNGVPPKSAEFDELKDNGFRDYRLRVDGLVENPTEFSLDDLRELGKHEQITEHDCVQGWSGVAKWGGVPIAKVLDVVKPTGQARYCVFYGFPDDGKPDTQFYDVHDLTQMYHPDSILAYEMNGEELTLRHGAPLRLRNESEFGFKQVKWMQRMEIRDRYDDLFGGEGGFREDNEYQSRSQEI